MTLDNLKNTGVNLVVLSTFDIVDEQSFNEETDGLPITEIANTMTYYQIFYNVPKNQVHWFTIGKDFVWLDNTVHHISSPNDIVPHDKMLEEWMGRQNSSQTESTLPIKIRFDSTSSIMFLQSRLKCYFNPINHKNRLSILKIHL